MRHPNHKELVDIGFGAFMSVAPISSRILETCEDDGYPRPTQEQMCAIMLDIHEQINSPR